MLPFCRQYCIPLVARYDTVCCFTFDFYSHCQKITDKLIDVEITFDYFSHQMILPDGSTLLAFCGSSLKRPGYVPRNIPDCMFMRIHEEYELYCPKFPLRKAALRFKNSDVTPKLIVIGIKKTKKAFKLEDIRAFSTYEIMPHIVSKAFVMKFETSEGNSSLSVFGEAYSKQVRVRHLHYLFSISM